MRRILRRREIVADDWRHLGEGAEEDSALIVPLVELRKDPERWRRWRGRLGVRLSSVDPVEELAADLPRLDLVAVEFPTPSDGRGYSAARLLRERLGFRGELRAGACPLVELSGSAMSAKSCATSSAEAARWARSMRRRSRWGASSCAKSYMYWRSSVPRRKPIQVVCAANRCEASTPARSGS